MFAYLQSVPVLIRISLDGQDTDHHMDSIMKSSITFKEEIIFSFAHLGHLFFGDPNYNIYNENAMFVARLPQEQLKFILITPKKIFPRLSKKLCLKFQPFIVYARAKLCRFQFNNQRSESTFC